MLRRPSSSSDTMQKGRMCVLLLATNRERQRLGCLDFCYLVFLLLFLPPLFAFRSVVCFQLMNGTQTKGKHRPRKILSTQHEIYLDESMGPVELLFPENGTLRVYHITKQSHRRQEGKNKWQREKSSKKSSVWGKRAAFSSVDEKSVVLVKPEISDFSSLSFLLNIIVGGFSVARERKTKIFFTKVCLLLGTPM